MSKDYKQSSRKSSSTRRSSGGSSSVFAGLLIGLCLGIAIAVAAALYLNKTPNPFASPASKNTPPKVEAQPPEPEIMQPPGQAKSTTTTPAVPPTPAKSQGDRFDFYTMLPELGGDPKPKPPVAKAPDATPPATVAPPKGTYLQAGAFQNETDADNLKAKLALVGVEANIQTADITGKGVIHRVRIGPLTSPEDIDRIHAQLKVNGIDSSLVKQ
ncbi:SPOR domain-containing protein [Chitinimonas sp. BJB300]|uniref:SPOR domain-containing protein n=1 Tax=Chitinimonas sp. BJB300 TaxID=1559339 RepID=UPI000C0DA91D|nr:SPOR domain-containing protein [Chitinimonas sp. BJB300]PHV12757.1 sporulation protein [Chitinimonas sp. BJB300]TSJ90935.1 SPOR domain-containing protein [Chitinimonas sp. BJB300]